MRHGEDETDNRREPGDHVAIGHVAERHPKKEVGGEHHVVPSSVSRSEGQRQPARDKKESKSEKSALTPGIYCRRNEIEMQLDSHSPQVAYEQVGWLKAQASERVQPSDKKDIRDKVVI